MPTETAEGRTVHTTTAPRELLATPPTLTTLLRIPRRRFTAFLPLLQALRVAWAQRHHMAGRGIASDYPRRETVPERVARTEPYLYIRSLSG